MRNLSSAVLSMTAMALSSLTTYLTFFDARYTMTTAVSGVSHQLQRSYSASDGNGSVNFRTFIDPAIITSNRGTRPLVLTRMNLFKSSDLNKCALTEDMRVTQMEAQIIEPGTVQQLPLTFELPSISAEGDSSGNFDLEVTENLWCLKWTIFDPNGRRHEPVSPAFTAKMVYGPPEPGNNVPTGKLEIDYPKKPTKLVSRGLF